jgi:large subunit ribosomal protein L32
MRSVPVPAVSSCPRCQEPKIPHRVCSACGYYKDRMVIETGQTEA